MVFIISIILSSNLFGQTDSLLESIGKSFHLSFIDSLSGEKINTEDMLGEVIVVNIWFKNCQPCENDIPGLVGLYNNYREKGVNFIGVNINSNKTTLINFCENNGINWPQFHDPGQTVLDQWDISVAPVFFIIDRDGNIVLGTVGSDLGYILDMLIKGEN